MLKQDALLALAEGKRITHTSFTDEEYVKQHTTHLYMFEDGVVTTVKEFWYIRTELPWADGWSIYTPKE